MSNEKKPITAQEAGSKGGKKTLKRHGRKHFVNAANARWDNDRRAKADRTAHSGVRGNDASHR